MVIRKIKVKGKKSGDRSHNQTPTFTTETGSHGEELGKEGQKQNQNREPENSREYREKLWANGMDGNLRKKRRFQRFVIRAGVWKSGQGGFREVLGDF